MNQDTMKGQKQISVDVETLAADHGTLEITTKMLAALARTNPNLAEEILAEELTWLSWLPAEERLDCVRELLSDLVAGADTGLFLPFARSLGSWRSTAEIWADPELAKGYKGRLLVMVMLLLGLAVFPVNRKGG